MGFCKCHSITGSQPDGIDATAPAPARPYVLVCSCICAYMVRVYVPVHIHIHTSVLVHLRVPGTQPKPHKPDCWRAAQHSPAGVQMALDEEEDLLVGPAPPDVSAEDELASGDDRSREVRRVTSCVPAHCCWVPAVMCVACRKVVSMACSGAIFSCTARDQGCAANHSDCG